jgi:hypothetical protein
MKTYIKVPIKILTPKLAQNKQDSIFYAGKNIAEVKVRDRTYVLTTAGEYNFYTKENSSEDPYKICNGIPVDKRSKRVIKTLTTARLKNMGDNDLISNWGWFSINVWQTRPETQFSAPGKDQCLLDPTAVWSTYDEALTAFIEFVEQDLAK